MVTVWAPPWATKKSRYEFPVEIGLSMGQNPGHGSPLKASGQEIVWSAIMAGRPWHLLHTPLHVNNQRFAQWRVTTSLGMLEAEGNKLRRPDIFHKEIDPTEKVFLNSMLGQTMTHAYLTKERNVRWLAHYRLFEKSLSAGGAIVTNAAKGAKGSYEPDYLGLDHQMNFVVAEAKGRQILKKGLKTELNKKRQTGVVASINNWQPVNRYGIAMATGVLGGLRNSSGQSTEHRENEISLYATDPEVTVDVPTPVEWVKMYYANVRRICKADVEQMGNDLILPDWIPMSFDISPKVMQWVQDLAGNEINEETWQGLRTGIGREYSADVIEADLTIVS